MSMRDPICLLLLSVSLLVGCDLAPNEAPATRALLIDHSSLPSHRHGSTVNALHRNFLAIQKPGDRLIYASNELSETGRPTRLVQLSDRPLSATRELRALHGRIKSAEATATEGGERPLVATASRLAGQPAPACLFLALNPASAGSPPSLDGLEVPQTGQWNAFLLVPSRSEQDFRATSEWLRYLSELGASRVQVVLLEDSLPRCR